jgi:hypothetical protein
MMFQQPNPKDIRMDLIPSGANARNVQNACFNYIAFLYHVFLLLYFVLHTTGDPAI